jgi:two-component system, OmpR family, response regulator
MRVLLVEDDRRLADAVARGLEEAGLAVVHASDGNGALGAALGGYFDVIVLDVMLPGSMDGFEVAARLRQRQVGTPILMLTGRDAVGDRVRGLESGADDYLLKPFAFQELLARLRALTRRHLPARSSVLRMGPVNLDSSRRTVDVDQRPVPITRQEFAVLEYFMLHPGQVLSRTQILEHAWPDGVYESGESNLVEVYVGRVRRKLIAAGCPDPFTTVRGAGYRMELAEG